MKPIHAIWRHGQIIPTQPVDWPEGTALTIEPIDGSRATEGAGDLLGDDPASIERWLVWFETLEPFDFTPEEEAAWRAAQREQREWEKAQFDERAERLRGLFE
jgi:hypothetical protein